MRRTEVERAPEKRHLWEKSKISKIKKDILSSTLTLFIEGVSH